MWRNKHPRAYKWGKLVLFYIVIQFIFFSAGRLAQLPLLNIISLEQMVVSDVSLNDLYYQLDGKWGDKSAVSGEVVLVNTGSLPADSFRLALAQLIRTLHTCTPAVIGVDHDFYADTSIVGTDTLIEVVNQTPAVVMGYKKGGEPGLPFSSSISKANVTFPSDQVTIRRYASDTSTFAYKIAAELRPNLGELPTPSFMINYLTAPAGYFTTTDPSYDYYLFDATAIKDKFFRLEAREILTADSAQLATFKRLLSDKAILLGHINNPFFGNPLFDGEDKHRVPCDESIVNRERRMPGVMVHANAIENMIQQEARFSVWTDSLWFSVFMHVAMIAFLYYILYANIGFAFNFLCFIALSIPILYLVLYLMSLGIYLEIGLTLLQFGIFEEVVELIESGYKIIKKPLSK